MVLQLAYVIRKPDVDFDPNVAYAGIRTAFSIRVHYGGSFTQSPGRRYINGYSKIVDELDSDEFSLHELDAIVEELGNDGNKIMFYHFMKPDGDLDSGLQPLGSDQDVLFLSKYVEDGHKFIDIYVEHEKTNPNLYFTSPVKNKRVLIEELDEPRQSKAGITPLARKDVEPQPYVVRLDVGQGSGAAKDAPSQGDSVFVNEFYSSYDPYVDSQDPNFDPFADLDDILPKHGPENVDKVDNVDNVDNEEQSEEQSEGFEGSDSSEHNDSSEHTDSSDDDSEDSDYIMDEENYVSEVDVDMEDFHYNIDETVEFMGCKNIDEIYDNEEEQEDIEVMDNDYFESASEEENELDRLRKRKLKQIRKQAHGSTQVYKTYFYVGQKFGNREIVKERVREHSIETRRELRMEKNDKERVRVVCRGIIPTLPTCEANESGNGPVNGPDASGSKVRWTKGKVCEAAGVEYHSPSKKNHTRERIINGGKPKSKKADNDNKCPWVLLVSKLKNLDTWEVRTHRSVHKCLQSRNNLYATSKWFAKELVEQLQSNRQIPVRAVQEQLQRKHELAVSESKAFRAKAEAEKKVRGDYTHQYKMLRSYALELQEANPNTTVKIHVQSEADHTVPTRVFKRIYVCLGPLKEGFKAGMREILGLDGTFMKGPFPGQLLTAVSVDSNNGIYPLAYGIVETENKDSWIWFLTQLGDDLDLYRNSNFTFISDRQKGLIPALAKLFPCAEHRFCVKHIHENMKLQWSGAAYKELLWKCATATTVPEFQLAMEEFRAFSKPAYEWLLKIPPQHWARSHFSGRAKTDVLVNNMCEVFNGKLVGGRDKAIISTLEFARAYLMKRIVNVNKLIERCDGPLTPTATKLLKLNCDEATKYTVSWGGGIYYEVSGPWNDQCVVNVQQRTCTCRKWELTGIPCKHAIATNWNMTLNQQSAGLPEEWVHPCYRLETWKKAYSNHIKPIRGPLHWPKCNVPTTLLPPTHQPQIGRPRKERRKSRAEVDVVHMSKNGKLTRRLKTVTCDKCGTRGHNSRSCTGPRKSQSKGVGKKRKERSSAGEADNSARRPTDADKGKGVAVDDGKKKKGPPRKKVVVLG